ncbi:hypothetical protein M0R45_010729 [Rubus argutus]|uniref:Uncharacterized protein n=1 Tax=Rubus argutus TaxID=59490 RepID=A0AAW1Y831_RUBAR
MIVDVYETSGSKMREEENDAVHVEKLYCAKLVIESRIYRMRGIDPILIIYVIFNAENTHHRSAGGRAKKDVKVDHKETEATTPPRNKKIAGPRPEELGCAGLMPEKEEEGRIPLLLNGNDDFIRNDKTRLRVMYS